MNKKTRRRRKRQQQKRDLQKQYDNLIKNGGLAHKPFTEQEAVFSACTFFKVPMKELTQGQILARIRHEAFYNYDQTVAAIRSPELRKEYHGLVNNLIFESYPWLEKYGYEKEAEHE